MTRLIVAFALIVALLFGFAPRQGRTVARGGYSVVWNGNLYGVNWVCLNSLVTGCSQAFNAVCSPSGSIGDDAAALNSFNTFLAAQTSPVGLYIAPGADCHMQGSTNSIGATSTVDLIIWGYGARLSNQNFGGDDFFTDNTHSSKIANVSAGSATISLVTPSEISRYTVGNLLLIGGVSTQNFGNAPNLQFFERKTIKTITTDCPSPCTSAVITLDSNLTHSLKSTWPDLGFNVGNPPLGGPAMLWQLKPTNNTTLKVYGLHVAVDTTNPAFGSNAVNRTIYFNGVVHEGAGWGFRAQTLTLVGMPLPGATEFDKDIETVNCDQCTSPGNGFFFQSASPQTLNITNSFSAGSLNGTGQNATVSNSTFNEIAAGVAGDGAGTSLTLTNVTYPNVHTYYHTVPTTDLTFSAGTFTILKSAGTIANVYATFVPGFKYYLGGVAGNSVCTPAAEFTVTDLREDATHVFIDIDQSTLPACGGGGTVLSYGQFHLLTASQTGSGPANIFSIPEMVP